MSLNVMQLANQLQTEADAWVMLETLRWGDSPVCAHCGCEDVHYVAPTDGATRKTRTGSQSARRVWKCHKRGGGCGKQFTVIVGTVFHGTKVPLRTWLFVLFEMVASKNGVAAREIERKHGLSTKTAWFVLHRIREAMDSGPLAPMLTGTVVADETFMGGKAKNKHRSKVRRHGKGTQTGPEYDKTPVLTLIDDTGRSHSRVVTDVTGPTLAKAMREVIEPAVTTLHTDGAGSYKTFSAEYLAHESVDHSAGEYVRGVVSTNKAENFFSQLKRSIDGTHHHVSREHLPRYLAEFDFRYSTRKLTDEQRLSRLMGQVGGRRLAYRPLVGRVS